MINTTSFMKQVHSWLGGETEMASYRTVTSFLFCVGILFQGCDSDVRCRNDNGEEVDWYILYKLPKRYGRGLRYFYMDESTNGWRLSRKNINSRTGTLAKTLQPLFDFFDRETEGFGYMLYNDQPPDRYKSSLAYGHSKGVVMLDRQTGVWLSHSTPKFPRTYCTRDFWPNTGNANAQTFLCMTYSYNVFKEIGLQLKYIHPHIFDSHLPTTFPEELRCNVQPLGKRFSPEKPWYRVKRLPSVGGHKFCSFAKHQRFVYDLYSGLIVERLEQDLFVKSWGKLRRPLLSNCRISHHVSNVKEVQLPSMQPFSDTVDHSKWCVTRDGGWTCIADMNREMSQMKRGGGAICTQDAAVGRAFRALVRMYEPCEHTQEL